MVLLALPAWLRADDANLRDIRRELLAQTILRNDPVLGPLDLGVTVHRGVARLFGPVPSKGLGDYAVDLLRRLPELAEVRNEMMIDPSLKALAVARVPAWRTHVVWPTSRKEKHRSPPPPPWQVKAKQPSRPAAKIPSEASSALEKAVEKLRRSDARFRRLNVEVQGQRVIFSGAVARWQDVDEFAQALTRMPGVGRVTIREIRTDAPRR